MAFSILTPNIASNTTKDGIISLLLEENALNAKEIYSRINKTKSVTYQAVFKDLQQLCKENVLTKNMAKYDINPNWIKQLKTLAEKFEQKSNLKGNPQIKDNKVVEFDTYFSFTENMLNLFASRVLIEPDGPNYGIGVLKHFWWSLFFGDEGFEKFKVMGHSYESYVVCAGNTSLDKWLKEYYEKAGFKGLLLNSDYKFGNDFAVIGNYVVQVFFDPETEKMIDQFYSNTKELPELLQKGFMESIFTRKAQIKVIITREPELAKVLREKLLPYFNLKEK